MNSVCPTGEGPSCIAIVPIFGGLTPEEMAEIAAITRDKRFQKGETVYRAGCEGKKLYVIHSGRVKISRLERAESIIEDINLHSAERRLAQSLLRLSQAGPELELAVTKGDLASQLGMTQETLSRKLSLFQDRGLISQKGQRRILILDREGLAKIQ